MPTCTAAGPAAPALAALDAGLRYVTDSRPGITRKRSGNHFRYFDASGAPIRDRQEIDRINKLRVPPAYRDVWICPRADGHIQATGRDARGRKQYRYHEKWREVRDENKYGRLLAFGNALPAIRSRVDADMAKPGTPRAKVVAAVIRLLETTLIRVGNEEYARANRSYGLTTLRNNHVSVEGASLTFHFKGKSGKVHEIGLRDRRLANIVSRCRDLPGQELFEYADEAGDIQSVTSADINDWLRETCSDDFTAKDFRTWAGTVLAISALMECCEFGSDAQAKRNIAGAIESVAARLGNTPAICRKCYIHPAVLEAYLDGSLAEACRLTSRTRAVALRRGLDECEAAALALLERHRTA